MSINDFFLQSPTYSFRTVQQFALLDSLHNLANAAISNRMRATAIRYKANQDVSEAKKQNKKRG